MIPTNAAVWRVAPPSTWPTASRYMSVSTLSELEACPRRWALSAAAYPAVWHRQGYPPAFHPTALEDAVAHLALEIITPAFSDRGCPSVRHTSAVAVLKELGGFTVVLGQAIQRILRRYDDNPRVTPVLDRTRRHLTARTANLRSRVQELLSRVRLEPRSATAAVYNRGDTKQDALGELLNGSHSEVQLVVEELGWKGVVDLLTGSDATCDIREFKMGKPKVDHQFPLNVYALLWWQDRVRNPVGRLTDRLVISYGSGDVDVPVPSVSKLEELRDELRVHRAAAIQTLDLAPPEARPDAATCMYCGVRHLCDAYWREPIQQDAWFMDIQLELTAQNGTTSYIGVVESCSKLAPGTQVLFRTVDLPFDLHPGVRLRVLNVRISSPDLDVEKPEPSLTVASMGVASEAFVLPS